LIKNVNTANTGYEMAICSHTSSPSHQRTIRGGGCLGAWLMLAIVLCAACDPLQGSGTGTPPDPSKYIQVDDASHSAIVTLIAGYPATDFQFNYDGYGSGALVLTVPVGWAITIQCENRGTVPNSCAIVAGPTETQPIDPALSTPNPNVGLQPGESAGFVYTPRQPGSFRIASLVDGSEASGMWLDLEVVNGGRPKLAAPGA
jgi:sulfocyanin SoxE-like protein